MKSTNSTPDKDYPYGIELNIIRLSHTDVGFYICVFNDSYPLYNEGAADELIEIGAASSIYIYVKGNLLEKYIIMFNFFCNCLNSNQNSYMIY